MSSGGSGDQFGQPDPGPYGPQGPFAQPGPYGAQQFGQPWPSGQPGWQQPRRTNSLAIAALCCGIAQVVAGPLAGIPAIILGFLSVGQIRQTGEEGRGMAITGLVLGIVGVMLTVLVLIFVVAILSRIATQPGP
jgi:hypothetical protein